MTASFRECDISSPRLPYLGPDAAWRAATAVLLAAIIALHLFSLLRTPPPHVDDAWYANRGWALIQTGRPLGTLDAGVFDGFEGGWTYIPWVGPWFLSLGIWVFGLSLFSVRVVSLAFGLVLLLAVYTFANHLYGPRAGLLAVLLTSTSNAFFHSSHVARPDIMVAALGFGAIALSATDRSSGISLRGVLAGLAVAAAFEIHPNGLVYAPAIAALYLLEHGRSLLRIRRFWSFLCGLGVGLLVYAAMHVLAYPQTYLALTRQIYTPWRTPPLFMPNPGAWLQSVVRVLVMVVSASQLRTPLIVAAFFALLQRRSAPDKKLLVLFGTLILAFGLLVRHKMGYFAIDVAPAADLLLAAFLDKLLHGLHTASRGGPLRRRFVLGLLVGLCMVFLFAATAPTLMPLLNDPMVDYWAVVERIRQTVPPDSSLMGSQTYWLGVPNLEYYSWENLVFYQRCTPGNSLEDAFGALRPDYFLIDRHMGFFIAEDKETLSEFDQFLHLPASELDRFLDAKTRLAATVRTSVFGTVRIYKVEWDRE